VEPTPAADVAEVTRLGDASAVVTSETERLLLMTARARRVVPAGRHGVHAQKVVRVDATRAHAAVMAAGAKSLLMAVRAETAVVARHALVPLDEVGAVRRIVQPRRG
jgi:hypothetical protein